MTYLLDTNVVSDLRRPDRADPALRAWAASVSADHCALSVITVLELERGILLIERRDPAQADVLRHWLEHHVLSAAADRILNITLAIARRSARLHIPNLRPERDALIAATALEHGLTVVTRNTADFRPMGVPVLDPWRGSGAAG